MRKKYLQHLVTVTLLSGERKEYSISLPEDYYYPNETIKVNVTNNLKLENIHTSEVYDMKIETTAIDEGRLKEW